MAEQPKRRIQIMGNSKNLPEVMKAANDWHMEYEGHVFSDPGEIQSEDDMMENTALFFRNANSAKTDAFIHTIENDIPDLDISLTNNRWPENQDEKRLGYDLTELDKMAKYPKDYEPDLDLAHFYETTDEDLNNPDFQL